MKRSVGIGAGHRGLVGLLGGSFDPPHEGHLHIANQAKKALGLNETWWVVAWGHRKKRRINGLNFGERLRNTEVFLGSRTGHRVCGIEKRRLIGRSLDSIRLLRQNYRGVDWVWIMGSDSFIELPGWYRWRLFATEVNLLVVSRNRKEDRRLLTSKAGVYLRKRHRLRSRFGGRGWTVLRVRRYPVSSSEIRIEKEFC